MSQDHKADFTNLAKQCALRPVKAEDKDLMLEIRNQDHVRSTMLGSDTIPADAHDKWFSAMLKDNGKAFFILTLKSKPAGIIGFYDIENNTANWTFYLRSPTPPKGLGTIMCSLGLNNIFENMPISRIQTSVLENNTKSLKLHQRLGFSTLSQSQNTLELELKKTNYEKNPFK